MTTPVKGVEVKAPKVGQRYRDDSGYLWDVIVVEPNGDAWCRHPNKRGASTYTNRGWFGVWTLVRDAPQLQDKATNREDGCP